MKMLTLWGRHVPIFLLAMLGGTALIVCNPGYFWDDWVWLFQSPSESVSIGKELGVFWGGYLTNAINALPYPSLTLRVVALLAWLASGAALCFVLQHKGRLSGSEAVQLFLIYAATHIVPIRFLTSVALYNVYIAAFWIACALLVAGRQRAGMRAASATLFFFSFYLNSLIVLYALLIALLALETISPHVTVPGRSAWRRGSIRANVLLVAVQAAAPLRTFALRHLGFLALPLLFVAIKKFTTVASPLYSTYNDIDHRFVLSAFSESFTLIRPVLHDFFATASRTVPPLALVISALVCFMLLRLLPRRATRTSMRTAIVQLALGWIMFAVSVYPYIIVKKVPDLTSFYDARNIMPAVAGLGVILVALINIIDRSFAYVPVLRRYGYDLLLGYVLGASICAGFVSGIGLWHDWMRQEATMSYLVANRDELREDRTFIFNDLSSNGRYRDRTLINYEYTGNLVRAFGGRSRFGISVSEYYLLPPKVELLINPYMKRRFSMGDYDFQLPHVIVTIRDGMVPLDTRHILEIVGTYLRGGDWPAMLRDHYSFSFAQEFIETEQRVDEMEQIAKALAAYRTSHGVYPTQSRSEPDKPPVMQITSSGHVVPLVITGDIPGLFPTYMPRPDTMRVRPPEEPNYLYISDGIDYKLVYANAADQAYAKQAHPILSDPIHGGYGVWTSDARNW